MPANADDLLEKSTLQESLQKWEWLKEDAKEQVSVKALEMPRYSCCVVPFQEFAVS